jgi:membrane-associated phospholipid phosphatase
MQRKFGLPPLAIAVLLHSVATFALLAQAYAAGWQLIEVDARVATTLHTHVVPSATTALIAVTTLGSTPFLALVAAAAGAYLLHEGRRREAALVGIALVGSQLLTWILKAVFERPRPSFDEPVATADWFSFPSGHALSSIALYGALAYLFGRRLPPRARVACFYGVALLIAAIGFSRLYLGVHFLTDVLAGYSAGLAWLLVVIAALHTRRSRLTEFTNR